MNIKNKITNWISDNLSSLVKFTGLLVSIGVLVLLCSCGDEPVLYDSEAGALEIDEESEIHDDLQEENREAESVDTIYSDETVMDIDERPDNISLSIFVHVCGAVKDPGVYEIASTARVIDAIDKAGGFNEEACMDALNLAAGIDDGSKIYVPTITEVEEEQLKLSEDNSQFVEKSVGLMAESGVLDKSNSPNAGGNSTGNIAGTSSGRININTATKDELMTLNGIGATRAEAIIDYREANGYFKSIEDIMNVSGIKTGSFDKIKDSISVN